MENDPANLASTSMPWDAMYSSTILFRRSARSCMEETTSGEGTILSRTVFSRSMCGRTSGNDIMVMRERIRRTGGSASALRS